MNCWLAFDKAWFQKHQASILWCLNAPLIGHWAKWIMRIRKYDVGHARKIVSIFPDCYTVNGDEIGTFTTDFRCHWKYSKRMYYAFRPIWWAMHIWDALVADLWLPALSFGFLVLTVLPNKGVGQKTVAGDMSRDGVSETWATIRSGVGLFLFTFQSEIPLYRMDSATTSPNWLALYRSIATYDTSQIGGQGRVISATLSVWGTNKIDQLSIFPTANIYGATPALTNNLSATDYGNLGSTPYANGISYSFLSISGVYTDFPFLAAGIAAILVNNITCLGFRNKDYDVDNIPPSWANGKITYVFVSAPDNLGANQDPKLVVTYSIEGIPFVQDCDSVVFRYQDTVVN